MLPTFVPIQWPLRMFCSPMTMVCDLRRIQRIELTLSIVLQVTTTSTTTTCPVEGSDASTSSDGAVTANATGGTGSYTYLGCLIFIYKYNIFSLQDILGAFPTLLLIALVAWHLLMNILQFMITMLPLDFLSKELLHQRLSRIPHVFHY